MKVSTLRTATAATLPVLASLLRKKWIVRETAAMERDARRTERFVVLLPETRLPRLTENQQAILAELAACGGECHWPNCAQKDLPSSTLQTLVRRGLVRIDERPRRFAWAGSKGRSPGAPERAADGCAGRVVGAPGRLPCIPAPRRDRIGKNRRLPGGHAAGARSRAGVDSAGSGDRADAAKRRPARCGVRRARSHCCTPR